MKTVFMLLAACCVLSQSTAQSPYTLTTLNQAYTPLTGATPANGGAVWHTQYFTMPLGFSAKIGNTTVNKLHTDGGVIYADTAGTSVDIFQLFFAHTVDRGFAGATSKSPLRYVTTGTAPNRIFKFENSAGGFFEEQSLYQTFADSFDCQFWLYEGTNVAELRFGNSKISHAPDYFQGGQPSFTGYFNVNFSNGSGNIGYFAAGPATAPYIDSFTATHMPALLSAYPAAGTVYRFTPKNSLDVRSPAPLAAAVYPTLCAARLTVRYNDSRNGTFEIVSLTGAATGLSGTLRTGSNALAVDALSPGMYMLLARAEGACAVFKFEKQ